MTNKVINVEYTTAHDGDRCHTNIPSSKALPAILHQYMMVPTERRMKESAEKEEVVVKVDTRTITEKLLELLTTKDGLRMVR